MQAQPLGRVEEAELLALAHRLDHAPPPLRAPGLTAATNDFNGGSDSGTAPSAGARAGRPRGAIGPPGAKEGDTACATLMPLGSFWTGPPACEQVVRPASRPGVR